MKKFLSFVAAMLFAFTANAQGTDFASPGYSCAADDAVLTGGSSSNFFLDTNATPHHIAWSDVSLSSNALATWTITATRGCYVSVSLDLGPVIASNKHIFEVKILDDKSNVKGKVAEPAENTDSEKIKTLADSILIPAAGTYTVELRNNRDWGKGTIKNVILTYVADAPGEMIAVDSIILNKKELSIEVEEVELLEGTVYPDNAFDPSITWTSSDEAVATVSETGLVTGIAAGKANITAKAGEKTDVCAVTVVAATIPNVDFAEPLVLTGKKAHLEGAIWKNDAYKLYGKGDNNKNYGTASWTINVTKPCTVVGALNGVEGGHIFVLDVYDADTTLVGSLNQPDGKTWSAGEIALDSSVTFAKAGKYILKLRNTQEWSSGKVAGITLASQEPVLADGYYLIGKTGWDLDDIDSTLLFKVNPANDKEYILHILLAEKDSFKIVKVEDDGIVAWYPDQADNYAVDAKHAGEKDIYFRPDGQGGEGWYYGVLFVEPNPEPVLGTHYVKVTEAPADWSGDYLLVYETGNVAFNGALTTLDATSNTIDVTISEGKIVASDATNAAKITIAAMTGGYSVKAASGKYLGAVSYSNSLVSSDTAIVNKLSLDASNNAVMAVTVDNNGTPSDLTMRFNKASNQLRFRYYKSGQEAVALYKLTTVAPEPTHTYTVAGAPAAVFGEEWNASYEENDMEFLANQSYIWIKDSVVLHAGTVEFKVVEDHAWAKAWPEQNYKLAIPEDGYYSIIIAFNLAADPDSIVEAKAVKVGDIVPEVGGVVYNWAKDAADQIGTTILGGNSNISIGTVKIHENTDDVDGIKFGSSYVYADGKWIAIKPAEGGFKAGDTIYTSVVFNNSDTTKYCMVDIYAADTQNRLFRSDSISTLNGRNAGEPIVQSFVLESDQDSLFLGRYGNTGMFITLLTVVRPGAAPEPQHTYTVAGAPATLFGKEWNASYAENDMESYGTDTYFWRRDSVALAAGNVEFKIVEDHSWSKGWPAQNYVLKIDSAGLYNITIMFKPKAADPDSMVSAIAYKVADAVVLPKIIMHGNFTGSWADTEEFAIAEDNLTASLKLNLTAGSYEFGMKFDGVWKANAAELTREAPETSLLEGNGNMKITADVDGEYIFTYTFLGEKLAVTYPAAAPVAPTTAPAAPTAAEDDVLAIYCNHYTTNNLNFGISGWAGAYQVLDLEGTNVGFWTAMTWECIIDPAHTDDAHDLSGYKKLHVDLWAPKAAKIKFTVEAVAGGNYKDGVKVDLAAGWNSFDFVVAEWTGNYDFKNVKCFVFEQYQTPAEESFEGNPFAFANIYLYDKEPQAIDNIDANTKATKTIVNGMLIIEKNGKTYNVLGTLVK